MDKEASMRKTHVMLAGIMSVFLFTAQTCGPGTPSQAFIDAVLANLKNACGVELSNPVQPITAIVAAGNPALATALQIANGICASAMHAVANAPTATSGAPASIPEVGGVPIHGTLNGKTF